MANTKTIIGKLAIPGQIQWLNDFTSSLDEKGVTSGKHTYICRIEDLVTLLPGKGTPCTYEGFSFLKLTSYTIDDDGKVAKVNCNYSGTHEASFEFDSEEGSTYEINGTTEEAPIMSHDNYKDISAEEKRIIQNVMAGKLEPVEDEPYHYSVAGEPTKGKIFIITSDEAIELMDFIDKGILTYLNTSQVYRITKKSKFFPTSLTGLGQITTPRGAPTLDDGRNWLWSGYDISFTNGIYTITSNYIASGPGGWYESLYS